MIVILSNYGVKLCRLHYGITISFMALQTVQYTSFSLSSLLQSVLNDHLSHIDQARMSTSDKLHVEFQDLELQLRKRLAELESRVEDTVSVFVYNVVCSYNCRSTCSNKLLYLCENTV